MSKIPLNVSLLRAAIQGRGIHDYRMEVKDLAPRGGHIEMHCNFPEPFYSGGDRETAMSRLSEEQRAKIEAQIAANVVKQREMANLFAQDIRGWLDSFEFDFVKTEIFYGIHPGHEGKGEFLRVYIAPAKIERDPRSEFEDLRSQFEGRRSQYEGR